MGDKKCMLKWPANKVLIAGDSILTGIMEKRISKVKNVKVRSFSGANIDNIYSYLMSLLEKEPAYLVLHVGSNDAIYKSSDKILNDLLNFKHFIENKVSSFLVTMSYPTFRTDNAKASLTLKHLCAKLDNL